MDCLLTCLLLWWYREMGDCTNQQKNRISHSIEFLDDFPLKVHSGSFFTFDTTNLLKQKFIFVVSGTGIAYFKQGDRLFIVEYMKREEKRLGYIDHFEGSGYRIKLDVVRVKKVTESGTLYKGVLELNYNRNVTMIPVHGINGGYKPKSIR